MRSRIILFLPLFLVSCATSGQEAGQGDNTATAAAGNAVAAVSHLNLDGAIESGQATGTRIEVPTDDGRVITIIPGKGVRDIYVHCEIENTADIQQSGTTTSEQAATPSTQTNPSATIPIP